MNDEGEKSRIRFIVSPKVTEMKEEERRRLKCLNKKLLEFIQRTKKLEEENNKLVAEVDGLKKTIKNNNSDAYTTLTKNLLGKIEFLQTENTCLKIERDNFKYELESATSKMNELSEECRRLRNQVQILFKENNKDLSGNKKIKNSVEELERKIRKKEEESPKKTSRSPEKRQTTHQGDEMWKNNENDGVANYSPDSCTVAPYYSSGEYSSSLSTSQMSTESGDNALIKNLCDRIRDENDYARRNKAPENISSFPDCTTSKNEVFTSQKSFKDQLSPSSSIEDTEQVEQRIIKVKWEQKGGTVHPIPNFDAANDAKSLYNAITKCDVDNNELIKILCNRTRKQRHLVAEAFRNQYNKIFLTELSHVLKGNIFFFQCLMWDFDQFDALVVRLALTGTRVDVSLLVEVICTKTKVELKKLKQNYSKLFGNLLKDVEDKVPAPVGDLISSILTAKRDPHNSVVSSEKADADVETFIQFLSGYSKSLNEKVSSIFSTRSFQHLWFMFNHVWKNKRNDDLIQTVQDKIHIEIKEAILVLIEYSTNIPPRYYAMQVHKSFKNKSVCFLIYIITSRCEVDLENIKLEYKNLYGAELRDHMMENMSGWLNKAVVELLL